MAIHQDPRAAADRFDAAAARAVEAVEHLTELNGGGTALVSFFCEGATAFVNAVLISPTCDAMAHCAVTLWTKDGQPLVLARQLVADEDAAAAAAELQGAARPTPADGVELRYAGARFVARARRLLSEDDLVCLACGRHGEFMLELAADGTLQVDAHMLNFSDESIAEAHAATQPGRNDPCPCGSGRKFKRCCLQ